MLVIPVVVLRLHLLSTQRARAEQVYPGRRLEDGIGLRLGGGPLQGREQIGVARRVDGDVLCRERHVGEERRRSPRGKNESTLAQASAGKGMTMGRSVAGVIAFAAVGLNMLSPRLATLVIDARTIAGRILATAAPEIIVLLTDDPDTLPRSLESYLLDVQPGFEDDDTSVVAAVPWARWARRPGSRRAGSPRAAR